MGVLARSLGRDEPLGRSFVDQLRASVDSGSLEVLAARAGERVIGVTILAYRLNISAGSCFASVEDLYVEPDHRRKGVGRELLRLAGERCSRREVSYVEVQVEDSEAEAFYAACGYQREMEVKVMSRSLVLQDNVREEGC